MSAAYGGQAGVSCEPDRVLHRPHLSPSSLFVPLPAKTVSKYFVNTDTLLPCHHCAVCVYVVCVHSAVLSSLSVALGTGKSTFSAAVDKTGRIYVEGTVRNNTPYLTKIGGFDVDLSVQGSVLLCRQRDQPGIVGQVGMALAKGEINISFMTVCRTTRNEEAIMAIGIDDEPTAEVRHSGSRHSSTGVVGGCWGSMPQGLLVDHQRPAAGVWPAHMCTQQHVSCRLNEPCAMQLCVLTVHVCCCCCAGAGGHWQGAGCARAGCVQGAAVVGWQQRGVRVSVSVLFVPVGHCWVRAAASVCVRVLV